MSSGAVSAYVASGVPVDGSTVVTVMRFSNSQILFLDSGERIHR
jgi:hypothetical protein